MTITIKEGYVYITNGIVLNNEITDHSLSPYTVAIATIKIEDDTDGQLLDIEIPNPPTELEANDKTSEEAAKPTTWVINLLKPKRVITVTGYLEDESTSDSSRTPAYAYKSINKKNLLHCLVNFGGNNKNPIRIVWGLRDNTSPTNMSTRHTSEAGSQIINTETDTFIYGITGSILKMKVTETPGIISGQVGNSNYDTAGTDYPTGIRKFEVMLQFLVSESKF